ncbi:MAG: GDP-mannose 4,6-dehydratase [Acidobacteriota bacterium]
MTCLVTGGTGFAGSSLVRRLVEQGARPVVLSRTGQPGSLDGCGGFELRACDLTDAARVVAEIRDIRPDRVYHLAARTFVPDSQASPVSFLDVNLRGTVNLLAAIAEHVPQSRVLLVSSAGVYGASGRDGHPLVESDRLAPMDPYAASKAAAEMWAMQEQARRGLHLVRVRPFGHIGPHQAPRFVAASFASQLGRIRAGEQPPIIEVGNLDAVREFNDVEDIVAGHLAALEHGEPGEVYNLCSGQGHNIRELLAQLMERSGVEAEIRIRSDRLRPADVPSLVGDPARAHDVLGWRTQVPFGDCLDRLLARWVVAGWPDIPA